MDREEAEVLIPVIKAFCEGKAIQQKKKPTGTGTNEDGWSEFHDWEDCNCHNLDLENYNYRIKPTPTYRPFANAEECWEEMKKHEPFGWVKDKDNERYFTITCVSNEKITLALNGGLSPARVAEYYTFADGTVFGKLTEE